MLDGFAQLLPRHTLVGTDIPAHLLYQVRHFLLRLRVGVPVVVRFDVCAQLLHHWGYHFLGQVAHAAEECVPVDSTADFLERHAGLALLLFLAELGFLPLLRTVVHFGSVHLGYLLRCLLGNGKLLLLERTVFP